MDLNNPDIYLEWHGKKIAGVWRYSTRILESIPGQQEYRITLSCLYVTEETVQDEIDFHSLKDFCLVVVRSPNPSVIYSGCQWEKLGKINDSWGGVLGKATIRATKRMERILQDKANRQMPLLCTAHLDYRDAKNSLAKEYARWIENQIAVEEIGPSLYEITLPYTDSSSDCLQIYAQKRGESILLTDGGDTIRFLQAKGFSMSHERKDVIRQMIQPYHVYLSDENALILETHRQSHRIPPAIHALAQAMLRVDMFGSLQNMQPCIMR